MYLLHAPVKKFGDLPKNSILFCDEIKFTNNIAICNNQYFYKKHLLLGCIDVSPSILRKMRSQRKIKNVVLFAFGGFGDSCWVMPFAKALKQTYLGCKIIILTEKKNVPLWLGISYVDFVGDDTFEARSKYIKFADEIYDFSGMATVYEECKKLDPIEAIFKMGDLPLPTSKKDCRPLFTLGLPDYQSLDNLLKDYDLNIQKDKYIVLATESSTPNRDWSNYYNQVLTEMLVEIGFKVVLLSREKTLENNIDFSCECGFCLKAYSKQIVNKISFSCPRCGQLINFNRAENQKNVINLTSKTNIRQAMTLISQADCFVGPNSGLMVISTGFEVPSVGLFGAFHPKLRTKFYEKFTALWGDMKCSPCDEHWKSCDKGPIAPCMLLIKPESVFSAVLDLIKKYPKQKIERID